ncbi:hypothetical protein JK364_02400 [Streptomyces sp. 110]|uniref:Uncharacterized protein n=1 Tax=Streptomyces endocoffeicus TaxID=2898945 RepID=A0ABS1PFV9_9ACTN|nr:hypothetical protein [Streptomyces endocoffeicus]MBL1111268.1 hypothetical protein [Streptomyces endocoffeicus]
MDLTGPAAQAFFTDRVTRDGWVHLRGFGYCAADTAMYPPELQPSAAERWCVVAERRPSYAQHAEALARPLVVSPVPWYPWLAWPAFVNAVTGEQLRDLTIGPSHDYQPTGRPPGPQRR